MCPTNDGIEDTEHFLLLCPDIQRRDLLAGVSELLRPFVLVQYLLYGNKELSDDVNKNMLKLTLNFIHKTGSAWITLKFCFTPHSHYLQYVFPNFFRKSVSHLMLST